jgi:actin-related protein
LTKKSEHERVLVLVKCKPYGKEEQEEKLIYHSNLLFVKQKVLENENMDKKPHNTFSSASKPEASILTPSIAKQQVKPCLGRALRSLAHKRTHLGPAQ